MTPARLMTAAVWLVVGGSLLAVGTLVTANVTGQRDQVVGDELDRLERHDAANPPARGDPVQNAAVGAAGAEGACCLSAAVFYPAVVTLVVRGRRRLDRSEPAGERVWLHDTPDGLVTFSVIGWALILAAFDIAASLPLKAIGDMLIATGWLVGVVAVRRHRRASR